MRDDAAVVRPAGEGLADLVDVQPRPGGCSTPQVVGRFSDGVGRFYGDEVINGTPVKVRYEWSDTTTDTPKWN